MIFVLFVLVTIIGYLGITLCNTKFSVLERIFIGYMLAIAGTTLLMFYISLLGGTFSALTVFAILSFILVIEGVLVKALKKEKTVLYTLKSLHSELKDWWHEEGVLQKIILSILFFASLYLLCGNFVKALYYPVSLWDALTAYDYSARILTAVPNIYEATLNNQGNIQNYPLFTALSHTLVYLFGGENPHFTYGLLYFSLAVLFYKSLRLYVSRVFSLVFTFLLLATPFIYFYSSEAYTNLPLTVYYSLGAIYIYHFIKLERKDYFWVGVLFLGISYWIRPEAKYFIWGVFLVLTFSCILKRKYLLYPVFLLLVFYAFGKPWEWYYDGVISEIVPPKLIPETVFALPSGAYRDDIAKATEKVGKAYTIEHITMVIDYIWNALSRAFTQYNMYLFLLVFVMNLKNIFKENIWMTMMFFVHVGIFCAGTFIFSYTFETFTSIVDSAARLVMTFLPLLIFYMGTIKVWKDLERKKVETS